MRKHIQTCVVRVLAIGLLAGLGIVADARPAHAQAPYPVRFVGPSGKTYGYSCEDFKTVQANQPDNTSCWAVIVWYKGTFAGFNNYSIGASAAFTASYACPAASTLNESSVYRDTGPERLSWYAFIYGPGGYITHINGQVTYEGGLGRNLTLDGIDPSKCNG
jgi:hypothetical protein